MKERLLRIATRRYWLRGNPLPVDIASRLVEQGVDVEALENLYT